MFQLRSDNCFTRTNANANDQPRRQNESLRGHVEVMSGTRDGVRCGGSVSFLKYIVSYSKSE